MQSRIKDEFSNEVIYEGKLKKESLSMREIKGSIFKISKDIK